MGKIYIIESIPKLKEDLVKAFSLENEVQVCDCAQQALEQIKRFQPDLLVMDMTMPGLDGLGLLNILFGAGIRPEVILSMNYVEDRVKQILSRFQVAFLLTRPVHKQVLVHRIMDVMLGLKDGENLQLRRIANDLLLEMGFRLELQGYRCTLEALIYACEHFDCMMSNELYPEVAKLLGGNAKQVEHCIRTCIQKAWENRNEQIWDLYFPRNRYGHLIRLNNSAFIKRMAYAINDFYEYANQDRNQRKKA